MEETISCLENLVSKCENNHHQFLDYEDDDITPQQYNNSNIVLDREKFIIDCKQAIHWYIYKSDYKSAFSVLLGLLYKVDDGEREEIINIYHKIMIKKNK